MRLFTRSVFIALFQGSLSIFFDQDWKLPHKIDALNGSCVDIPCTYTPPKNLEAASVAWYLLHLKYVHIFNSRASSLVRKDYENRTSLVPGNNSCTLRIDPVRKEDKTYYYPGIAENPARNAIYQGFRFVWLDVKESPEPPTITIPKRMTEGTPTNVTCLANHTCGSSPPTITWNKPGQIVRRSEDLLGGYWREKSELVYNPSHEDDGTPIRCTITYHNGHTLEREAMLDIRYYKSKEDTEKMVYVTLLAIFGFICLTSLTMTIYLYRRKLCTATCQPLPTTHDLPTLQREAQMPSDDITGSKIRLKQVNQATARRPKPQLPDAIYAILEKTDISTEYGTLKPASLAQPRAEGTDSFASQ